MQSISFCSQTKSMKYEVQILYKLIKRIVIVIRFDIDFQR